MSAEFFNVCDRILSATANGVYQGVLVAALAGLLLKIFTRTNAATRHAVWFGVLLFVAALIPAHLYLSFRHAREERVAVPKEVAIPKEAASKPMSSVMIFPLATPAFDAADLASGDPLPPAPPLNEPDASDASGATVVAEPAASVRMESGEMDSPGHDAAPIAVAKKPWWAGAISFARSLGGRLTRPIQLPHWISLGLIGAWALLSSARGAMIAWRLLEVRRVKKMSRAASEGLEGLFGVLRESAGVRRPVQLRISDEHQMAVALGFLHPVVLLPAAMDTDLPDSGAEHVLRHELAHVRRRDDWSNLAQQLAQAALFFNPAIWWISSKLSLEREIACDDHVIQESGRPRAYAVTLANLAIRMNQGGELLAPGVSNNNSQLQQRITMILNTQRNRSPRLAARRLGLLATATAVLAVLAINAGPRLVLAQTPPAEPPEPPAAESAPTPEAAPAALPTDAVLPVTVTAETPVSVSVGPGVVTAVAPVTVSVSADGPATPQPGWSDAETGPRPKAPAGGEEPSVTVSPLNSIPTPPEAPEMPGVPPGPMILAAPGVAPVAPAADSRPGAWKRGKGMSIEERLDRIERMLDELQARGDMKKHHTANLSLYDGKGNMQYGLISPDAPDQERKAKEELWKLNQDRANEGAAQAEAEAKIIERAGKRSAEEAQRAMEAGQRAMEAGQREAEKAMRDFERQSEKFNQFSWDKRDLGPEDQLKALEALRGARESLQSQIKVLEKQIQKLERDQNRMKYPGRHESPNPELKDDQDSKDDLSDGPKKP